MSESKIKGFMTLLGAPIIATVKADIDTYYMLENALFLVATPTPQGAVNVQFQTVMGFTNDQDLSKGCTLELNKTSVLYTFDLKEDLRQAYANQVGAIITPPIPKIKLL